jgi:hypothetical protein
VNSVHDLVAHGATVLLAFVVIPLWLLAGLADYFCHRASNIERTSGTPESLMHLAQFGLVGVPILVVLFFRVDAGVLFVLAAFAIAHHRVAYADLRYATGKREITPVEQMVHSFLELLPLTAWLLLAAIHFDQLEALRNGSADLPFHIEPVPMEYLVSVLVGASFFGVLPYLEELSRCLRYAKGKSGHS